MPNKISFLLRKNVALIKVHVCSFIVFDELLVDYVDEYHI